MAILDLASNGSIKLVSCQIVVDAVEIEILKRAKKNPEELDDLVLTWQNLLERSCLLIAPDPPRELVELTLKQYLPTMRHLADIPVLASAIELKASVIISSNREHFNDTTAKRCGISMLSPWEFLSSLIPSF